MKFLLFCFLLFFTLNGFSKPIVNDTIADSKKKENTKAFDQLKRALVTKYAHAKPGKFGEFVKGSNIKLNTNEKVVALTFDACAGKGKWGYNSALIDYLRNEKIPATLFVSGKWINSNVKTFKSLVSDSLFEIENHGDKHRLCSVTGASVYGIQGTHDVSEVVDEMELNAIRIEKYTGKRPKFFRSATVFIDETSVNIANDLGMQVVSYSVLSGDAIANTPDSVICSNILSTVEAGSIVIMHFNHPLWQEKQALQKVIPALRDKGFSFVKLQDYKLLDKRAIKNRIKATN